MFVNNNDDEVKIGEVVRLKCGGRCDCGVQYYYDGLAELIDLTEQYEVFELNAPFVCQNCQALIELHLANRRYYHPIFDIKHANANVKVNHRQ